MKNLLELYILSNKDLDKKSVCQPCSFNINLDEQTNGKSTFILPNLNYAKKHYYIVLNGLYKQFLFLIDDVVGNKKENIVTVTALDINNIFDRKIISKNINTMTDISIEDFIGNTMIDNFINSDDSVLNLSYIDIYIHTHTQILEPVNDENGLYNFHTFLVNCRQHRNICCDFKFDNGRLRIDIENKTSDIVQIDTTLKEITDYNKIYGTDQVTKVEAYIREDGSIYNLYLRADGTTTENKDDPNRADGIIETISVDTLENAKEQALNTIQGNKYNHLVEFKIPKTSKLVNLVNLNIGTLTRIKTEEDVYDSYISAIVINNNDNFIYFKSGNLRINFLDKIKQKQNNNIGNKIDVSGGKIKGNLDIEGELLKNGIPFSGGVSGDTLPIGAMVPYGSDIIPDNWLLCDGREISRTDYSELFAVLGTSHGVGDGSTTFNIPGAGDYTIVGKSSTDTNINAIGKKYGSKSLQKHYHSIISSTGKPVITGISGTYTNPAQFDYVGLNNGITGGTDNRVTIGYSGEGNSGNMQPSLAENYIIKAKQSAGIVATVVDGFSSTSTTNAASANSVRVLNNNKVDKDINHIVYKIPIFGIAGDEPVNYIRNNWTDIGVIWYNLLIDVNNIPVPTGYTRYVRGFAVYTDSSQLTGAGTNIGLFDNAGAYKNLWFDFERVYGATANAKYSRVSMNKFLASSLGTAWTQFKVIVPGNQQVGAAGQIRYFELQFIDIPN